MSLSVITANWPAPERFTALTTLRAGGVSQGAFSRLNLGLHVGDDPAHVNANRARLQASLGLPGQPVWLKQTHSTLAVDAADPATRDGTEADAIFTTRPGNVCAIMTADCVPIVLCAPKSNHIAALHAGWRGLADGIIEATLEQMNCPAHTLMAWIGPCISQVAFEVGDEVRQAFVNANPKAQWAFAPNKNGKWQADLVKLSTQRLQDAGITGIYGGQFCTYREPERFFSYRRDKQTGRMATLIWCSA